MFDLILSITFIGLSSFLLLFTKLSQGNMSDASFEALAMMYMGGLGALQVLGWKILIFKPEAQPLYVQYPVALLTALLFMWLILRPLKNRMQS
ncbi:MAG TPA: hypothetical protein PKE06_23460 [Flavilitoribacter sp.]|nr:hypothetical protein [Flavilitoribacter sp.]